MPAGVRRQGSLSFQSRSIWRKANEIVLAQKLERVVDKKRILEVYLNVVELGPGIYGAEAAAQHYWK